MAMKTRIIQWNISFNCTANKIADYISQSISGPTIVNLQEVTEKAYREISSILMTSDKAYSIDLRRPGRYEGKNRTMGVATFVFGGKIAHYDLIYRSVFPERTLFSTIQFKKRKISVLNFHSLTGVDYKKAKSSNFASIADFIAEKGQKLDFFTCDANEPKTDALDDDEVEFADNRDKGYNASLIFGKNKVHALRDAYKIHIQKSKLPIRTNPLATSHVNGGSHRRYDFIYCSKEWDVQHVSYPYKESVSASSDHSIVIGDFLLDAV
ncbi:MAG: hypothetical protein EHM85_03795 [Desulfobacteraceae bacterium]|nr:MAG: hypothetical protein EHM85_03795 [Desulfobacteraceae bacterium]